MASPAIHDPDLEPVPFTSDGWPILYEDEDEGDKGESNPHVVSDEILHVCLGAHFAPKPQYRVFSNMNCYYRNGPLHKRTHSKPYISPDNMVVKPFRPLGDNVTSYTIDEDGPAPVATIEVLSQRSAQQRDLAEKAILYAKLKIPEYILVDVTGRFLPRKLLLKRLRRDGSYENEQDPDGGVTSRLGFRLLVEIDGNLREVNAKTGRRYPRPSEAADLENRNRELQAELEKLKAKPRKKRHKNS